MSRRSRRPPAPKPRAAESTARAADLAPAPKLWRDAWAWCSALAILPLLARLPGAPAGEPVAEDFDFLHRALLQGMGTLLDGGGSHAFWRPLAHQLYYAALGPLIVSHPLVVAALHALLLACGAVLLYRTFRTGLSGPVAAIAASFPLLAESTRTLVTWPTQFVDVGLFLFSALALHEASRRRLPTALAALLAALLCKEVAVVTAVLLPLLPGSRTRRERVRAMLGSAAVLAAWGLAYLFVRQATHLELPHQLEHDAATLATPLPARLAWALAGSARAILSLTLVPGPRDSIALGVSAALIAIATIVFAVRREARARLRRSRGWIAWGLAWFVMASAALAPIYPLWQPNRSQIGSVGLGVSLAATLGAAHPALGAALVGTRLALLALAPGAAAAVATEPPATGAFMDFERLTRLQRFLKQMRVALQRAHPHPPPHSTFVDVNMPKGLSYALGGDRALQVWYRDSTLHLVSFDRFRRQPDLPVEAIIQFQPGVQPEIFLLDPAAARAQEEAFGSMQSQRLAAALAGFDRADSLEPDPAARIFHANNAGLRAILLDALGRPADAETEARRGLALFPHDENSRFVIASALVRRQQFAEAERQLDSLLLDNPAHSGARKLLDRIAASRGPAGAP